MKNQFVIDMILTNPAIWENQVKDFNKLNYYGNDLDK